MRVGEGVRQKAAEESVVMRRQIEKLELELGKSLLFLAAAEKQIETLKQEVAMLKRRLRHKGGHQTH